MKTYDITFEAIEIRQGKITLKAKDREDLEKTLKEITPWNLHLRWEEKSFVWKPIDIQETEDASNQTSGIEGE